MSNVNSGAGSVSPAGASGSAAAANAGAQAGATGAAAGDYSSEATVGTMASLKQNYPKVYKFMMLSIAQNICIQMQHSSDHLKQEMRKMRQNNN